MSDFIFKSEKEAREVLSHVEVDYEYDTPYVIIEDTIDSFYSHGLIEKKPLRITRELYEKHKRALAKKSQLITLPILDYIRELEKALEDNHE